MIDKSKPPEHSPYAFSASVRWIPCAASMAHPDNTKDTPGGKYADEGTAAHDLAARCLKGKKKAHDFLGDTIKVRNGWVVTDKEPADFEFTVDEEFADAVQTYVDDVDRRTLGGIRFVERRVTLNGTEGFTAENFGSSDVAAVNLRKLKSPRGLIEDLKFGKGVKVYAFSIATEDSLFTMDRYIGDSSSKVEPNFQLMMYAGAALPMLEDLVGEELDGIDIVINQPRLDHISELYVPREVIQRFLVTAADALARAKKAQAITWKNCVTLFKEGKGENFFGPSEKACEWCKAIAACPAAKAKAQAEIGAEFDDLTAMPPVPADEEELAIAYRAVPFIAMWCTNVTKALNEAVSKGSQVIGADGRPLKLVEGRQGNRGWVDAKTALGLLAGSIGDKAYVPREVVSVAVAEKLMKAKPKAWAVINTPENIKRNPGKPILALGSDDRPPFSPSSSADEFDDVS